MKRAGNIYWRIGELDNLLLAFWKAQRGKRGKDDVKRFRLRLHENLSCLRHELLSCNVTVGDYHYFTIHDPKVRRICAASFRERVLHHAIMNICEPVLERYAIFDSYACRKGKGTHQAIMRARSFARNNKWCLKVDVSKYFDSIDHRIMYDLLTRRFKDKKLLSLFARIIGSYETEPGKGLPIGNLTSQHFANYYLGPLDHYLKEDVRVPGYVRYMDDMIIWGKSRLEMKEYLSKIRVYLAERLALRLKEGVQIKQTRSGVGFLGYGIYPWKTTLAHRSRRRFSRKFKYYEGLFADGKWSEETLADHVQALLGFTLLADAKGFRKKIMAEQGALSKRARTA